MNRATTLHYSWYQNNRFLSNSVQLKIRLLQCYVVLWIHNISAICRIFSKYSFIVSFQADKKDPKDPILPFGIRKVQFHTLHKKLGKEYNLEDPIWETGKWCIFSPSEGALWHHHQGCAEPLKAWINSSGDILFVIGFCVIAFLKVTFLGILHYEIKEMIQKIKMIHKETLQMNGDLLRLGTLTSNSPILGPDEGSDCGLKPNLDRPTDLPGPVNTLVTTYSGSAICTTTAAQNETSGNNQLNHHQLHSSKQTAI